jgi:hypothetical protein
MQLYYLDTETTGFDRENDRIITIQYQPITMDGRPQGPLKILKSWELGGESRLINIFLNDFDLTDPWKFVPVGFNLRFDLLMLYQALRRHGYEVDWKKLWDWPHIDLKPFAILTKGAFKGSNLNVISPKQGNGGLVPHLLIEEKYDEIEAYIRQETEAFLLAYQKFFGMLNKSQKEVVNYGNPRTNL